MNIINVHLDDFSPSVWMPKGEEMWLFFLYPPAIYRVTQCRLSMLFSKRFSSARRLDNDDEETNEREWERQKLDEKCRKWRVQRLRRLTFEWNEKGLLLIKYINIPKKSPLPNEKWTIEWVEVRKEEKEKGSASSKEKNCVQLNTQLCLLLLITATEWNLT